MAKIEKTFSASLTKNTDKGGAWLGVVSIKDQNGEGAASYRAFSNASAGKRWIKEMVIALTPRKSIKMISNGELDEKEKPTTFVGEVIFKAEK